MKLGIIGAGSIVQEFLPWLVALEGIEVIAIQGSPGGIGRAEALCQEYGIPHATDSFDSLCALGIDTVYVAVPNFLHVSYCRDALNRRLNVIVEKPMTSNYGESLELEALAKKNRCFLFEAITTLYLGNYQKIREWLPRIGTVKLVQSQFCQYSRRYDAFRRGEILPVFDPDKAGGALMDLNLYNLHFVMGLFGKPEDALYYANIERGIDTGGMVVMQYPGFLATCIAAKDCGGLHGSVIQGTDGCIKCHAPANSMGEVTLELNDGTTEAFDDGAAGARLVPEFTAFVRAINEKDYGFCYDTLSKSLAVSELQTRVRRKAGIRFPSDVNF